MYKLLTRLLGNAEEMSGGGRCPTYLYRWVICRLFGCAAYVHHFVGDAWSLDLHDHPKRFISIGLNGWYLEATPCQSCDDKDTHTHTKAFQAPWVRTFAASHIHRISVPSKNCWTLVIVLRPVREWGFVHEGRWIPWRSYVKGTDQHIADKMKACD